MATLRITEGEQIRRRSFMERVESEGEAEVEWGGVESPPPWLEWWEEEEVKEEEERRREYSMNSSREPAAASSITSIVQILLWKAYSRFWGREIKGRGSITRREGGRGRRERGETTGS